MQFFLGTHQPPWLATMGVPLCVSRRRLQGRRTLPRAAAAWLLDSGGFTELSLHGRWTLPPEVYAAMARRYQQEIGRLVHAAPMDWMCEPAVRARTGLDIPAHQRLTIENLLELRALAPDVPWFPVLQGWEADDYLRHADAYQAAGVDLTGEPLVGVGTVCRRQHTAQATEILRRLHALSFRLHGFGLKVQGLLRNADHLASADSLSWSFDARRLGHKQGGPWCGSRTHKNCANCRLFSLAWRERLLEGLARRATVRRVSLFDLL